MRNLPLSLLICISFSVQGFSQDRSSPFGFHRGMTQKDIIALVHKDFYIEGDTLHIKSVPKPPHPDFDGPCGLTISPDKGLLQVRGMGVPKRFSMDEARDKFHEILGALEKTYGKANNVVDDVVGPPQTKERLLRLQARWKAPTSEYEEIILGINPLFDSRGFVGLYQLHIDYLFVGFPEYFERKTGKKFF